MTINQFIYEKQLKRCDMSEFGMTYYILRQFGDVPVDELPAKYRVMLTAAMARYGECCE